MTQRFWATGLASLAVGIIILALLPATPAQADWVVMRNGHLLRGDVEERSGGKVKLRLQNGIGTATIDEDAILAIEPEMQFSDRVTEGFRRLDALEPDGALRAFQIALKQQDGNAEANCGYILALRQLELREKGRGYGAEAMRRAKMLRALHREHPQVRLVLGLLLHDAGEFDAADAEFDLAAKLAPLDPRVRAQADTQRRINAAAKLRAEKAARDAAAAANNGGNNNAQPASNQPGPLNGGKKLDPAMGDNIEARWFANQLLVWARKPDDIHKEAFITGKLTLAPVEANATFESEQKLEQYRKTRVSNVALVIKVEEVRWLKIEPQLAAITQHESSTTTRAEQLNIRERQITLAGWYYQLKQRYPLASISILVVAQRRGHTSWVQIAEAKWDESRQQLAFNFNDDK